MGAENFRTRSEAIDDKSEQFLKLLIDLGGYCTVAHAEELKLAPTGRQARGHLRRLERLGLLRRVAAYPVVYQVTKSVTRHLGRDSGARRRHPLPTVQTRLLAVDFYIAARKWPAEFTFDHEQKIATFTDNRCPIHVLPHRGGRPYLREEFLLWPPDGRIGIALIDQAHIGARSQIQGLVRRYLPVMCYMNKTIELLMVSGNERRHYLYRRLLQDRRFRATWPNDFPVAIKPYWVLRPTPVVAALLCPACHRPEHSPEAPHDHIGQHPSQRKREIHASRLKQKPLVTDMKPQIHCDLID